MSIDILSGNDSIGKCIAFKLRKENKKIEAYIQFIKPNQMF